MIVYNNKYGTTFGCANAGDTLIRHSYRDYGLFPVSKPVFEPPEPKILTVDIPGADGEIDYTEALTGDVHYETRKGTFSFVGLGGRQTWEGIYHRMLNDLHGKRMGVITDEDSGGYYYGRLSVKPPKYDSKAGGRVYIDVEGDFYPYRYDLYSTVDPWVWDTFPFPTGIIRNYKDITIQNGGTVTIVGGAMPVVPDVVVKSISGTVTMWYPSVDTSNGRNSITLTLGSQRDKTPDFVIRSGEYALSVIGGPVTFDIVYREGAL